MVTLFDEKKTHRNLSWALYGSTFYEIILTVHRIAIFSLLPKESYGFLVTLLAVIHLGTHIADFGATNSIPPLLHYFTRSKHDFLIMLWRYTILPHVPIVFIITGAVLVYTSTTSQTLGWGQIPWTVGVLIVIESIEAFMRQFLYAIQYVRETVIIETTELLARLGIIWSLFFYCSYKITPELILYSHLIEAGSVCIIFIFLLRKFYANLPDIRPDISRDILPDHKNLFIHQKIPNYLLRLSRNIFTTSFLTPLFAVQYGLSSAGIFYFSSKLSKVAFSAIKITIGYNGSDLLAQAKNASREIKNSIFSVLSKKLISISIPMIMLCIPATTLYTAYWQNQSISITLISLSFLFLILSLTEFFFILYEAYFIIEEASVRLFIIKISELGMLWVIVHKSVYNSPQYILTSIIILRITTLLYIAYTAHKHWQIAPTFEYDKKQFAIGSIIIAVLGVLCCW